MAEWILSDISTQVLQINGHWNFTALESSFDVNPVHRLGTFMLSYNTHYSSWQYFSWIPMNQLPWLRQIHTGEYKERGWRLRQRLRLQMYRFYSTKLNVNHYFKMASQTFVWKYPLSIRLKMRFRIVYHFTLCINSLHVMRLWFCLPNCKL